MRTDRSAATPTLETWLAVPAVVGAYGLLTALLVYFSYLAMGLVAGLTMSAVGLKAALMLAELALAAPGLVLVLILSAKPAEALGWRPLPAAAMGLTAIAGLTLWVASAGLMELQSSFWAPPPGYIEQFRGLHALLRPHDAFDALFSVAAIALAPAVCEELLFRGVVLPAWLRAPGPLRSLVLPTSLRPLWPLVALVISAALFGSIHVDTVSTPDGVYRTAYRVPFALAVGLVLGLLRLRTGSLLAPMLAHAVLNTFTLGISPYFDDPMEKAVPGDARLGLALMLAGTFGTAALMRAMGRLKPPGEPRSGPPMG